MAEKTTHNAFNTSNTKRIQIIIAMAFITLAFFAFAHFAAAQTNTTAVVIQTNTTQTTTNTTNKTEGNIIPTRALNPIVDYYSNVTSTATYRLPVKNLTKVDCRLICPINCNYRNQPYFNTIEDTVLVTARFSLNYTANNSFDFFATTHPAFQKCTYTYGLDQYTPFIFKLESLDKLTIYYKNTTQVITFSNTTIDGTNLDILPLNKSIHIKTNGTGRVNMLDNESDIEFGILTITENEEKYRKTIIRDYYINISISKTGFIPVIEEPVIIVEENVTAPVQREDPIKSGNLIIAAKSTVQRPVSFIVGTIIASMIIIVGLGLYYGYKKMNW